ncbi:hypothetical protein [Paenibacillus arenilitoris]|nr:hypothetical protein [Paenibacillus arenilitoris]
MAEYAQAISDGFNKTTTSTKRLTVIGGLPQEGLRQKAADGDVLTGQAVMKGTESGVDPDAVGMSINDETISQEMTYLAIESDAYFAGGGRRRCRGHHRRQSGRYVRPGRSNVARRGRRYAGRLAEASEIHQLIRTMRSRSPFDAGSGFLAYL